MYQDRGYLGGYFRVAIDSVYSHNIKYKITYMYYTDNIKYKVKYMYNTHNIKYKIKYIIHTILSIVRIIHTITIIYMYVYCYDLFISYKI